MNATARNPLFRVGVGGRRGFSLPELLVVAGIIALLISVMMPPLQLARRQAMDTFCATQIQHLAQPLTQVHNEFNFYPVWDDAGTPVRFTWIDVLVQLRQLPSTHAGYCPVDARPDRLNMVRGLANSVFYPGAASTGGMDYSYGIGAPLSAGGWKWQALHGRLGDERRRRFDIAERDESRRVLAADGNWSNIYNLSGRAIVSGIWNDQSWYDNMVAWRHRKFSSNVLFQDGHVQAVYYRPFDAEPVNTSQVFVWYPGEPYNVGPDDQFGQNFYPDTPPPSAQSVPAGDVFPDELLPWSYTVRHAWTLIDHKSAGTAIAGY